MKTSAAVDPNWWKKVVFYQIYPRSFKDSNNDGIGDLPGIISCLDYLNDGTSASLGIDAIWFSPFFTSPDYDFGYDIADYCNIDPRYGSLTDFDRLMEEAHRREIKVILDLVVNHTSIEHPWFTESRSSRNNPKRDWYIWKDGRAGNRKPPNNWRNNFFGPAWSFDERTEQYYLHSFLREQPDLNWANPEVLEAIGDVIRFWLDRGADGFRLDVAHIYCKDSQFRDNPPFFIREKVKDGPSLKDRTLIANVMKLLALPEFQARKYNQHQPEIHQVLREFRRILDSYPAKTSIGEILSDDPALVASYYGKNSDELHMNFYFEMLNCRFNAKAFQRCIERWERALPPGAWPAYTFSNHDVMRASSRYDHDGRGEERVRLLMMMLLTLRGTPFIYYGEEIPMKEIKLPRSALQDPVGRKWYPFHPGRDGCRTPMQWNGKKYAGFSRSKPWLPLGPDFEKRNLDEAEKNPNSMLHLTRQLIRIRKDFPALQDGSYQSINHQGLKNCYCFQRHREGQELTICLNFSTARQRISPVLFSRAGRIILSTNRERETGPVKSELVLEPLEGCIMGELE